MELADGTGDVFLHANALSQSGHETVSQGATLRVKIGQGPKGRQVAEVHVRRRVDGSGPSGPYAASRRLRWPPGRRRRRSRRLPSRRRVPVGAVRPDLSTAEEMIGTVKWYNATKGFGFITPQSGGKDIFVHASALERSGLTSLNEGQTARVQVVQGMKGPEAAAISVD